jgi:hypothetical protein
VRRQEREIKIADNIAEMVANGLLEKLNLERDVVRRLVRVEMRCTQALRNMGLIPGREEEAGMPPPEAVVADGRIIVTRLDLPLRDIARAAVLAGVDKPTPIYYNSTPWGIYQPAFHNTQPQHEDAP